MVMTSMPGPAQQRVGVGVAVVGEHHAGLDGDEVVAAVPLLALRVVVGAAGLHHPQLVKPERAGDHFDERLVRLHDLHAGVGVAGMQHERLHGVDDVGIDASPRRGRRR